MLFEHVASLEEQYQVEGANSIFQSLGFRADSTGAEDCYNNSFAKFMGDDVQLLEFDESNKEVDLKYIRACLESFLIYPMYNGESKNSCTKEDIQVVMAKAMQIMSSEEAQGLAYNGGY